MMVYRITFVFLFQLFVSVWAAEAIGNAVAVIGSVSVVRSADGTLESLTPDSEIYLNDVVQTGADGLAKLLLRDESILKVSPNSELVISEMIAGPGEGGRSTVDLLKGRIRSVIGNKLGANSEFNVNTPVAVAGVRGTDFEVVHLLVDGRWVTGVRCFDGVVAFSKSGLLSSIADILILPDQYSLATETEQPSDPQAIPTSSSLLQLLGLEDVNNGASLQDIQGDDLLDVEQVQALLLNIDPTLDINVQTLVTRLSTQLENNKGGAAGTDDVQLDAITQPLENGAKLNFEIDIPLPN